MNATACEASRPFDQPVSLCTATNRNFVDEIPLRFFFCVEILRIFNSDKFSEFSGPRGHELATIVELAILGFPNSENYFNSENF